MLMYHLSKREIRAGSQLTRGVYGERIRRDDFLKAAYGSYLKEEIFEDIRQRYYPDAPSRFKAVFLFADLTTAKAFWANQDHYQSYIYSVRLAEDAQPFLAEMELLRTDGLPYSDILERAHAYWQQKQQPESMSLEAICTGTVLVEELILPPSSIL
ncbi:hypothetical protein SapgrDRAFT_0334 [Saprospira grandis DSM 2844]|uniref:Uncharacterized protein n=1 Tax=Saprospira grandis DSM 2844 TaxID=694433 RepID=J1I089_9BACT|nr:DUF2441 domain-containing protein [Saprospira grandis]EJF52080.1 hypothetical protein SapgrDRAFT_0334 [Saprospira grandis DSM 2844]